MIHTLAIVRVGQQWPWRVDTPGAAAVLPNLTRASNAIVISRVVMLLLSQSVGLGCALFSVDHKDFLFAVVSGLQMLSLTVLVLDVCWRIKHHVVHVVMVMMMVTHVVVVV